MSPRTTYHHHESFELRVLSALAAGATSPHEVAAGLTVPPEQVQTTLDWAVGSEAVSRLDLPDGGASYTLTPKGMEIVGLAQGFDRVVSPRGAVDLGGALTQEQLSERTDQALTATTVGELRAAAHGVVDLPQALPQGVDPVSGGLRVAQVEVNPALRKIRWHHLGYAAAYVVVGVVVTMFQPVLGLVAIAAGLVIAGWTLRPLLQGRNDVTSP